MPAAAAYTSHPALLGEGGFSFGLTQAELDDVIMALKAIRGTIKDMTAPLANNSRQSKPLRVRWDTPSGVHLEATCTSMPPNPVSELLSRLSHLQLLISQLKARFELTVRIAGARPVDGRLSSDAVAEMYSQLDFHSSSLQ